MGSMDYPGLVKVRERHWLTGIRVFVQYVYHIGEEYDIDDEPEKQNHVRFTL